VVWSIGALSLRPQESAPPSSLPRIPEPQMDSVLAPTAHGTAKPLLQPGRQKVNESDFVTEFARGITVPAKGEARAEGPSIQHTRLRAVLLDLPLGLGQRVVPRSGQFVFPADQDASGKQLTHFANDLGGRFEANRKRARTADDFGGAATSTLAVFHASDPVIAERRNVKDRGDFVLGACMPQQCQQVIIRIKQPHMAWLVRIGMRRSSALETEDFKSSPSQHATELDAEFAS